MPTYISRATVALLCAAILFCASSDPAVWAQTTQHSVVYSSVSHDPVILRRVVGQQNDMWINGLGFLIENTSTKPVYFVRLVVVLPTVLTATGNPVSFDLTFGDSSMRTVTKVAEPEFAFIPAGQTAKIYVSSANFNALASYLSQTGRSLSNIAIAQAFLQHVSFGDGTGYLAGRMIGDGQVIQCPCTRYEMSTMDCPSGCSKTHYDSLPASHSQADAPCGTIKFTSRLCFNPYNELYEPCDIEHLQPCIASGPGVPFPVGNEW